MFNSITNNVGQVSSSYNACSPDVETTTEDTRTGSLSYTSSGITTEADNVEISSGPTTSDEPISWGEDYDAAMAQAQAEGKQVIIIFGRPACGNCTRTQNNANGSAEVRGEINENYVAIHVNIDTPEGRAAFNQYRDEAPKDGWMLPLTCVVDPNNEGTATALTTGTQTASALLSSLVKGTEGKASPTSTGAGSSINSRGFSGLDLSVNKHEFTLNLTSDLMSDVLTSIYESNDSIESGHTENGEINTADYIPTNNTTPRVTTTLPPISAE